MHRHKPKSWTLEDDTKLVEFVTKHGTKSWKMCEEFIENHTRISCRTRYLVISKFFKNNPDGSLADLPRKKQTAWSYVNTQNWTEKLQELANNPNAQLVKKVRKQRVKNGEPKQKPERTKKIGEKKDKPHSANDSTDKPKRATANKDKPKRPTENRVRQKPIYVERLRSNGIKLYHSFKYAYNAQVGVDPCSSITATTYSKLGFVKDALRLQELPANVKNYRFDTNVPKDLRLKINKCLKQNTTYKLPHGFSLPPSWSTAMGFRALCIQSACTDMQSLNVTVPDESNMHIQRFRQRLRTLFYTTALLSRLHPLMVGIGETKQEHEEKYEIIKHFKDVNSSTSEDPIEKTEKDINPPPGEKPIEKPLKRKKEINSPPSEKPVEKKTKMVLKSAIDQVLSIKREKMEM